MKFLPTNVALNLTSRAVDAKGDLYVAGFNGWAAAALCGAARVRRAAVRVILVFGAMASGIGAGTAIGAVAVQSAGIKAHPTTVDGAIKWTGVLAYLHVHYAVQVIFRSLRGSDYRTTTIASGGFSISVPPGTYRVFGWSNEAFVNSGDLRCPAVGVVMVRTDRPSRFISLVCP